MKWFCIRKAKIPLSSRTMFERYGVNIISAVIAGGATGELHSIAANVANLRDHALEWLTEQFDRAERKDAWSITMEAAITIFVAVETVIAMHGYFFKS